MLLSFKVWIFRTRLIGEKYRILNTDYIDCCMGRRLQAQLLYMMRLSKATGDASGRTAVVQTITNPHQILSRILCMCIATSIGWHVLSSSRKQIKKAYKAEAESRCLICLRCIVVMLHNSCVHGHIVSI